VLISSVNSIHIHCSLWNPGAGDALYIMVYYFM